jgi:hypothetical protein
VVVPKAIAVFDADDSRLSAPLARINGKMLALQSRMDIKFNERLSDSGQMSADVRVASSTLSVLGAYQRKRDRQSLRYSLTRSPQTRPKRTKRLCRR